MQWIAASAEGKINRERASGAGSSEAGVGNTTNDATADSR